MTPQRLLPTLWLTLTALLLLPGLALGQNVSYNYQVLIDADKDSATGCAVTPSAGPALEGFEHRLLASVNLNGSNASVASLQRQDCNGSSFGAASAITEPSAAPYAVALDAGLNGADGVELAVPQSQLLALRSKQVRLAYVAERAGGSDVLATRDGTASGNAIVLNLIGAAKPIPTLSWWGMLALLCAVFALAILARRRLGQVTALSMVMLLATVAWAMDFMLDGDLSDWSSTTPLGQDAIGDATSGDRGIDLVAGFAAQQGETLYFRLDVVNLDNTAPSASADSYATDEDTALAEPAPGVLSNDSDPDSDPLSATLTNGPTNAASFSLNADGSFSYTPDDDFNGTDSFSYTVSDGQTSSAPATVSITVTPVNDAPAFTADGDVQSNEDAGPQTNANWASNLSDGDDGSQSLSFNVTNNTNPSLFSVAPSVDANTGTLSYTSATNANGSADITVVLSDSGGTANGGTDSSTPQTFTITVNPVNDAPSFTAGTDQTVLQDSGAQTVVGWANNLSDGDDGSQVLQFDTTTNNDALFASLPSINPTTGTLSFAPAAGATGTATITTVLRDDGGTSNGGEDQSPPASFTITVQPLAQASNDTFGIANGSNNTFNVLNNDTGPGLQAVSFGASEADVGDTPADGVAVLGVPATAGTINVSMNAAGDMDVFANGTAGSGSVSVYYAVEAGNGSSDIGRADIAFGATPTATDDTSETLGYSNAYTTNVGSDFAFVIGGLRDNDTLGTPAASITSWGGGDASASPDLAPGDSATLAGGTLTVNSDGTFGLEAPTTRGTFSFQYVLSNAIGSSQARVEIYVREAPTAVADAYTVNLGTVQDTNNVTDNDSPGSPPGFVNRYADTGDIGGASQAFPPNTYTHPSGGFEVTINEDGDLIIDASVGGVSAGSYTFDYRLGNDSGNSIATVTVNIVP